MKDSFNGLPMTIGQIAVAYGVYGICFGIACTATCRVAGAIEDAYGYDIQDWMERHNPFKKK